MNQDDPLKLYKRILDLQAEARYLELRLGMYTPPHFQLQSPPKPQLQQELRAVSDTLEFRQAVSYIRQRFWIPQCHIVTFYSENPAKDDLSELRQGLWIDIQERLPDLERSVQIRVGGMDWNEDFDEWQQLLVGRQSEERGEPQAALLRFHILWLLEQFGLPRSYGHAVEQFVIFGYADPIPAVRIEVGSHSSLYAEISPICLEIFPWTRANDIVKEWKAIQWEMRHIWKDRVKRPRLAPRFRRHFGWLRRRRLGAKALDIANEEPFDPGDPNDVADAAEVEISVRRLMKRMAGR